MMIPYLSSRVNASACRVIVSSPSDRGYDCSILVGGTVVCEVTIFAVADECGSLSLPRKVTIENGSCRLNSRSLVVVLKTY